MCNCCGKNNQNKVLPVNGNVSTKQYGRKNGWSCPWHPLQIIGWFFILLFALTHFAILVFYLPLEWIPAGVIVSFSIIYIIVVAVECLFILSCYYSFGFLSVHSHFKVITSYII